ncbi:MAG: hypothetical protein IIV81_02410, partial [Clostridia bacterium]|nr:hypothetical protein [Clostridia bacterium]
EHKRGYEHSLHMGRVIADTVRDMWNETEKKDIKKVSSKVSIVYNQTRTKGVEHFEECKEHIKKYYGDTTTRTESGLSYTEADRIVNMVNTAPLFQKIPVTLVELDDIAFYGLAGEPFTNYAAHVRAKYPEKFIFTGCGTNGYEGYLPTTVAYEQGGYEVVTSPFTPTIEDDCLKEIEKLFKGE